MSEILNSERFLAEITSKTLVATCKTSNGLCAVQNMNRHTKYNYKFIAVQRFLTVWRTIRNGSKRAVWTSNFELQSLEFNSRERSGNGKKLQEPAS